MARQVDELPTASLGGRAPKYPWDEWMNGSVWELTPGEDFDCTKPGLYAAAAGAAKTRGLGIRVRNVRGDGPLYIQAVPKDAS